MPLPLKGRLGKIAYSIGSIGDTGSYTVVSTFLLYFLIDIVYLDPWLAALTFSLSYGVWNALNDPIVGILSDRTHTRFGRRRPWIMIGAPLCLLFYILIWSPPLGGAPLAEPWALEIFLFMIIVIAGYEFTYSMAAVTWFALFPEMWESVEDRSEVVIYRQIFAIIGGAFAVGIFPLLVASLSGRFGEFGGWTWAGGILGAVFTSTFLISLLGIRERKEFALDKPLSIGKSFKTTFSNKTLVTYAGVDLMTWCMFGWLSAMAPFFIEHSLGMGTEDIAVVMGPEILGTIVFFSVWRKLYIRYGPKVTLAVSTILIPLAFIPCLFIQTILQVAVWGLFIGIVLAGILLAREVMMGDVVDEDEIKTGVRREGSYFGVMVMIEKLSMVIIGVCTAVVLSLIGYVSGLEPPDQPPSVGMGIRLGMVGFMALYTAMLLIFLKYYPLGKEKVVEISKKIEEMHAEKAEKLEKMTKAENSING